MATKALVASLKGKLIVSVQAYEGEPLRQPAIMAAMALACEQCGAAAIRCQGISDIAAIKGQVRVPVLVPGKERHEGVDFTPTLPHPRACVMAGADIVALDASDRPRPDGRSFEETVAELRDEDVCIMADCRSIEDVSRGFAAGCDICSTTLSHGVAATDCTMADGPDIALISRAISEFPDMPIVCEGRVHTPEDAKKAMDAGAWSVVVGTAITHPTSITSWFKAALEEK